MEKQQNVWMVDSAQQAFETIYDYTHNHGIDYNDTKALFNVMIIHNYPMNNLIKTKFRKWSHYYAEQEWMWYLDGTLNPDRVIKAGAKLWDSLRDNNGNVMSNYGYWWNLNNQLDNTINLLKRNPNTRRAAITLYDSKISHYNEKDVICTYAIHFYITNKKLNMNIIMRSNDLWYGYCNDQYCFSKLQQHVSDKLRLDIGTYTHIVNNLHIYDKFLNRNNND